MVHLLTLLMVSFDGQKFLILMKSIYQSFLTVGALYVLFNPQGHEYVLSFFPGSFIVLLFTFRSMIHLELILGYRMN